MDFGFLTDNLGWITGSGGAISAFAVSWLVKKIVGIANKRYPRAKTVKLAYKKALKIKTDIVDFDIPILGEGAEKALEATGIMTAFDTAIGTACAMRNWNPIEVLKTLDLAKTEFNWKDKAEERIYINS